MIEVSHRCDHARSLSCVWLSAPSWTVALQTPLSMGNSPGKNTGVGSHSLLQGIFPTQGWNLGLLHCRQILYHLSHQEARGQLFCTTEASTSGPTGLWVSMVRIHAWVSGDPRLLTRHALCMYTCCLCSHYVWELCVPGCSMLWLETVFPLHLHTRMCLATPRSSVIIWWCWSKGLKTLVSVLPLTLSCELD